MPRRKFGRANMRDPKSMSAILARAAGAATVFSIVAVLVLAASGQTMANPATAQKTGKACGACHTTPPALNDAGKKYKETGK
jgi:cytochrome c551/c552